MIDREKIISDMKSTGQRDYERYLNTSQLLACQKDPGSMVNEDELQFQIVHQVEELWMKLVIFSLLDSDRYMCERHTNKVVTLFDRINQIMRLMTTQLTLLETMSPRDYQAIRLMLGAGSGQESPGFRVLIKMPSELYRTFQENYLDRAQLTLEDIYDVNYHHCDAYMVAECLAEFDELFQKFRFNHFMLVQRSIGAGAQSLKGRSVELLKSGMEHQCFPELWKIRNHMTDKWGGAHGYKRATISASGCPFSP